MPGWTLLTRAAPLSSAGSGLCKTLSEPFLTVTVVYINTAQLSKSLLILLTMALKVKRFNLIPCTAPIRWDLNFATFREKKKSGEKDDVATRARLSPHVPYSFRSPWPQGQGETQTKAELNTHMVWEQLSMHRTTQGTAPFTGRPWSLLLLPRQGKSLRFCLV